MKALSNICKVLTAASAAATALFFFFDFFVIKGFYSLTGINMIVNSTKTVETTNQVVTTYKSSWYIVALILALVTAAFAVMSIIKTKQGGLKFKGMKYATAGAGTLLAINMLVIFCSSYTSYLDVRTSPETNITLSMVTRQPAAVLAFVVAMVAFVLSVVTMFVADYAEVLDSHGAKLPIPARVKNFFKDYKSEIKKIVWPSRNNVIKNVIIVLIMCVVIGAFIWILDFGLAKLLSLILGI